MERDDRNILEVLKAELNFLKKGGYGSSPREPWKVQLFLEDSPSCMNYDGKSNPAPCAECALIQFVPLDKRDEKVPCRYIPLTTSGESLFDLYRGGTQAELEDTLADWLQRTIVRLETAETGNVADVAEQISETRPSSSTTLEGVSAERTKRPHPNNLHPKCANPSCIAAFGWLVGGRLFRFNRETSSRQTDLADRTLATNRLEHFWLCETCSKIYTLEYAHERGVLIRPLWPELPAARNEMHLPIS